MTRFCAADLCLTFQPQINPKKYPSGQIVVLLPPSSITMLHGQTAFTWYTKVKKTHNNMEYNTDSTSQDTGEASATCYPESRQPGG
ncbi:hypothetical protein GDO78_004728 [Eleutherodactylus coqui]|uniref:Uncharacterized protein n=1 Tax=Eleutherodactylus coqui TaxID=57060 RepID=A0A8J6ETB5_ELECQ|nr:hypothetical protein GDO78_004728 [Eleutherodactylus coqui]